MLPKVLVVSNDPISKECANGRTMGELLLHYPTDRLAELYTNDRPLDMVDCSYFLLIDVTKTCPHFFSLYRSLTVNVTPDAQHMPAR